MKNKKKCVNCGNEIKDLEIGCLYCNENNDKHDKEIKEIQVELGLGKRVAEQLLKLYGNSDEVIKKFKETEKNIAKKKTEPNASKEKTQIIFVVLCTIVFIGIIIFAVSNKKPISTEDAYKYQACRDKTNTYYKCSWSVRENRCICKER